MKNLIFLLFFFSVQGWGVSIEITKDSDIYAGSSASTLNELLVEGSENATSTDMAPKVYIPFYSVESTGESNMEYSLFANSSTSTFTNELPAYEATSTNDTSIIRHEFTIQTEDKSLFLFAAQVVDNKLYILNSKIQDNPIIKLPITTGRQTTEVTLDFKIFDLCHSLSSPSSKLPCEDLSSNLGNFKSNTAIVNLNIYFFLVEEPANDTIPIVTSGSAVSEYPNGIYFNYLLSNYVISNPPIIDSVAMGDERLKVNFSSGSGISYLNDVIAIKYPDTSTATEQTYYQALLDGGVIGSDENGAQNSGSLIVKDLKNGESVKVGVAYVSKFKFASLISEGEEQTPQAIQTFLQEKECYLLSAGFQKDHFVLEYFRTIRDNFLIKNLWGRGFIKWYYKTAPFYAEIIYENKFLRFVVRALGYLTYFTIRFFPILLSLLLIIFTFRKFRIIKG